MLNSIHAVYLFVSKVKDSSHWYAKVLNRPLEIDEDNFAQIIIGTNEFNFHLADSKSPLSTGGSVSYWQVDDLLSTAHKFVEHGGVIYRGPIPIPNTDQGICQIKDPFGNVLGLQGGFENG